MAKARTMKLEGRIADESRVRCPSTNLGIAQGATLRAAGIERCAGPVRQFRKPSDPVAREGNIDAGKLDDTGGDSGGVMAAARREGFYAELVKPSGTRGEIPRSRNLKGLLSRGWPRGP